MTQSKVAFSRGCSLVHLLNERAIPSLGDRFFYQKNKGERWMGQLKVPLQPHENSHFKLQS